MDDELSRRLYRLEYVVEQIATAIAAIFGAGTGWGVFSFAMKYGWGEGVAWTLAIVAFVFVYLGAQRELDLFR